ncbi:glycosyltransferase family A protein [Desulfosporosinus sp. SB140]|uniref:glycosyltransferase family A protein n=1 Tax=Desulfosporosinus paludis TaxID=3115649 RepID=UPI003890ECE0
MARCIRSVMNQTHKNLDILLVHDGSQDSSGAKCDKYTLVNNRIKAMHKTNGGLSDTRNDGRNSN